MSAVEDCIERIKKKDDVQAYVICTRRGDLLRHYHRGDNGSIGGSGGSNSSISSGNSNNNNGSGYQNKANKEKAQKYCDKLKVKYPLSLFLTYLLSYP